MKVVMAQHSSPKGISAKSIIMGAAAVLVAGLASCASLREGDPDVYFLLPREPDIPGWEIVDGPHRFDKTNMALYMESDAALLREYRAWSVAMAIYRPLGGRPETLAVWVYRLGSPVDAFGFYARKAAAVSGIPAPPLGGDDITAFKNGLLLRKGAHFVSIVTDRPEAGADAVIFARIVLDSIPPVESGLPEWSGLFGADEKRNDLVYYPKGVTGVPLSVEMFVRRRLVRGAPYEVYYSRRPSISSAMRDFTALLDRDGGGFTLASSGDRQAAFRLRPDGGYVFAARYEDVIFGVLLAGTLPDGNSVIGILMDEISGAGKD